MAVGDKIFIADKATLDTVNRNLSDVHSRVGTTSDGGGSATGGSLFAKLNAIISSIAAPVANWTAARAAKIDTISTDAAETKANTAINNTANANGTLSQKLSHIINLFTNNGQKFLVSKVASFTSASVGTFMILNVTGPGQFEFAFSDMGDMAAALTFEIDGVSVTLNSSSGGMYIVQSVYSAGALVFQTPTANYSADAIGASMRPLHFKNSLKITVNKTNTASRFFRCNYAVYE